MSVEGFEGRFGFQKRVLLKRSELTSNYIQLVINDWLRNKPTLRDLGFKFRISASLAHRIIKAFRFNPESLHKKADKESHLLVKLNAIK